MTPGERNELNSRIRLLSELKLTDGFKLLDATLKQTAEQFALAVSQSKDAHTMARAVGGWDVARQLSTWVDREIQFARQQLEMGDLD